MSIDYTVAATLVLSGDGAASAKLEGVARRAEHTRSALLSISQGAASGMASVGAVVERTIDRMASLTVATAKWGAIAAVGGAIAATKVGLVNVNAELEKTELGFATMFTMFGSAGDFTAGLSMGRELLEGIRRDAAALPGEFQDFASMAQTMTAPLTQLGQDLDGIRRVTRETVVTAAALGLNFNQASREMAMLLEGHAGAHNILGLRLGIRADTQVGGRAWHEAAGIDRLKFVEALMGKTAPALDAYAHSWAGLTSTVVDSLKRFAGDATAPLFGRIKGSLTALIDWENRHERQIDRVAYVVGTKLVGAYDWLEGRVRWVVVHWDTIEAKVERVTDALVTGFERAWPVVEKVGTFLEDKLEHPATALKELIALRVGASALTQAPRAIDALSRLQLGGAGSATAAVAPSAAATESLRVAGSFSKYGEHAIPEAGLFAGASEAGAGSAEVMSSFGGLAAGAGAATLALAALAGSVDVVTMKTKEQSSLISWMGETGQEVWRDVKQNFGSAIAETKETFSNLWHSVRPLVDLLGIALLGAIDGVIYSFRLLLLPLRGLAAGIDFLVSKIPGFDPKAQGGTWSSIELGSVEAAAQKQVDWWLNGPKAIPRPDLGPDAGNNRPLQKPPVVDARGSRFEIRLDVRNDNPDRIVRRVFDAIGNAAARPLTSSYSSPSKAF